MITNPVATRKESKDEVKATGDYAIFDLSHTNDGIKFCCPHDGCGDVCHLPLEPLRQGWHWDEKTKTLHPSIQRLDKERCHHHFSLIDGKWVP
jgi:hypothetical protein